MLRLDGFDYNENPQVADHLFVCGLHRSGTTMLERLLVSHFDLAYLRASVPESEGQHMQSLYSPARLFGGPGRFAFSSAMQQELENLPDHDFCRRQLLQEWGRFHVGASSYLLEKSPPNLTKIWWLRLVFPGARFIILTRDPRAVSAATQKWSGTSLPELMMHWNVAYSAALRDFSALDCLSVRYEDLVSDPQTSLDAIGAFGKLRPSSDESPVENRFLDLKNSNQKYLAMHECASYGRGAWDEFGYEI